ncbi:MAG: cupredoxin domain-containing protein, partial [Janthinobacterium sp.]
MKTTPSLRAIAAAVCVLALPLSVQAQASLPASAAATVAKPAAAALKRYELQTNIVDGKMVFIDAKGQVNPVLAAKVGDTVELVLKSGEGAEHDFLIPELNVASAKFSANSGSTSVRFKVTRAGTFTYYCSIPGHRQIGMEGKLEV